MSWFEHNGWRTVTNIEMCWFQNNKALELLNVMKGFQHFEIFTRLRTTVEHVNHWHVRLPILIVLDTLWLEDQTLLHFLNPIQTDHFKLDPCLV
jgi:hypothetical protein